MQIEKEQCTTTLPNNSDLVNNTVSMAPRALAVFVVSIYLSAAQQVKSSERPKEIITKVSTWRRKEN